MSAPHQFRRLILMALLVLLLTAGGLATANPASAGFSACTGDPTFVLSNLKVITSSTQIATDASSVQSIQYLLHVPRGVLVIGVSWSLSLGLLGKEHVKVYNDSLPGVYTTDALVQTVSGAVPVTATTTLGLAAKSVSGFSGQHLVLSLSPDGLLWAK